MNKLQEKFIHGRISGIPYRLWKSSEKKRMAVRRRYENVAKESIPVFLLGSGRSGTNMLTRALSNSYQVKLYNEDHPAAFDNFRVKDLSVIEELNEQDFYLIKLYKPILDTNMALQFLDRFPRSKIIFIFRNVSDVVNSSIKRFGLENWPNRVLDWVENDFDEFDLASPPENLKEYIRSMWQADMTPADSIALYWLFYNRLYFDLGLDQSKRTMLVNYETIVTQPNVEIEKICDFIGIKFSTALHQRVFSSSVKRNNPPAIREQLRKESELLWNRLADAAGLSQRI